MFSSSYLSVLGCWTVTHTDVHFFYVYIYMVVICFQKLQGALSQCYLRSFKVSSSIQNGQHWIEENKERKKEQLGNTISALHPPKGKRNRQQYICISEESPFTKVTMFNTNILLCMTVLYFNNDFEACILPARQI